MQDSFYSGFGPDRFIQDLLYSGFGSDRFIQDLFYSGFGNKTESGINLSKPNPE
jgi:hypothetical protein